MEFGLLGIRRKCPICQTEFVYCESCWTGYKYCGQDCRMEGRRRSHRAAEKRYTATQKGIESRRERQKNFRIRKILGQRVTDQSIGKKNSKVKLLKKSKNKSHRRCWDCRRIIKSVLGESHDISKGLSNEGDYFSFIRFRSKTNRFSF